MNVIYKMLMITKTMLKMNIKLNFGKQDRTKAMNEDDDDDDAAADDDNIGVHYGPLIV